MTGHRSRTNGGGQWAVAYLGRRGTKECGSRQTMAAYVIVEMEEKTLLETKDSV